MVFVSYKCFPSNWSQIWLWFLADVTTAGASQAAPSNPAFPFPFAFNLLGSDPSKITGFAALSSAWVFPSGFLLWQPGDLFFSSFIFSYAGLSPLSEVDKLSPKVLAFMRRNLCIKFLGAQTSLYPAAGGILMWALARRFPCPCCISGINQSPVTKP